MKKLINTFKGMEFIIFAIASISLWQTLCGLGAIPAYLLPSPWQIMAVIIKDISILSYHACFSLAGAILGLLLGVACGFMAAALMDRYPLCYRLMHPLMVLSQSIPSIALAPLLVLWLGYGLAPKVALIVLICFFPVASSLYGAFQSCDRDLLRLLQSLGASWLNTLRHLKLPQALPDFFAGLKVAATYAVVGAVVAEWMGGNQGLGVYMTRAKKSFAFDRMFAAIVLVTVLSQLLVKVVIRMEQRFIPWQYSPDCKE